MTKDLKHPETTEYRLPDSDPKACLAMNPRRFETLVAIMGALRSESGCPWDKAQTHVSLARYLLEECYEVLDAIEGEDRDNLIEELGDVLFQVAFHAQLGRESESFDIGDVLSRINRKMIHRHPSRGCRLGGAQAGRKANGDAVGRNRPHPPDLHGADAGGKAFGQGRQGGL